MWVKMLHQDKRQPAIGRHMAKKRGERLKPPCGRAHTDNRASRAQQLWARGWQVRKGRSLCCLWVSHWCSPGRCTEHTQQIRSTERIGPARERTERVFRRKREQMPVLSHVHCLYRLQRSCCSGSLLSNPLIPVCSLQRLHMVSSQVEVRWWPYNKHSRD